MPTGGDPRKEQDTTRVGKNASSGLLIGAGPERGSHALKHLIWAATQAHVAADDAHVESPSVQGAAATARSPVCKVGAGLRALAEGAPTVNTRIKTYTAYSIGCAVVWAVILTVVATVASKDAKHTVYVMAGGWAIGWLSATIARSVYPPPRSRQLGARADPPAT